MSLHPGIDLRINVVTVVAVAILVDISVFIEIAVVDEAVAIVVFAVAELFVTGMDRVVVIITVPIAGPPAVFVGVCLVRRNRSVAGVIDAVTELLRARMDRGVRVVTVQLHIGAGGAGAGPVPVQVVVGAGGLAIEPVAVLIDPVITEAFASLVHTRIDESVAVVAILSPSRLVIITITVLVTLPAACTRTSVGAQVRPHRAHGRGKALVVVRLTRVAGIDAGRVLRKAIVPGSDEQGIFVNVSGPPEEIRLPRAEIHAFFAPFDVAVTYGNAGVERPTLNRDLFSFDG